MISLREMDDNIYGSGEKKVKLFETWDDAIALGNENERLMGQRGNELLKEVLKYRAIGTPDEIQNAFLVSSEKMKDFVDANNELAKVNKECAEIIEAYAGFGSPHDVDMIYTLVDYLANGKTIQDLINDKLELIAEQNKETDKGDDNSN